MTLIAEAMQTRKRDLYTLRRVIEEGDLLPTAEEWPQWLSVPAAVRLVDVALYDTCWDLRQLR